MLRTQKVLGIRGFKTRNQSGMKQHSRATKWLEALPGRNYKKPNTQATDRNISLDEHSLTTTRKKGKERESERERGRRLSGDAWSESERLVSCALEIL